MIYNFRFKNFLSFAEETKVSFELNSNAPETDSVFTSPRGVRLSKLMAVQGANGAGKTNALKALSFLGRFVAHSFVHGDGSSNSIKFNSSVSSILIEVGAHIFSEDENSEMGIEFEHERKHYKYLLVVNNGKVLRESLSHKTSGSFNYIFRRELTESGGYSIRQKGFGFAPKEAKRVRANASLISTAAQYNVPYAVRLADYFDRISSNISMISIRIDTSELVAGAAFLYEHSELQGKMVKFMRQVDLGLTDVTIELPEGEETKTGKHFFADPMGVHRQGRRKHQLPFWQESSGTRTTFVLLQKILPVLEHGGVMVIDELDAGLHPDMVMALLRLFTDTESNPHHAQIIFTSYLPDVMDTLLKEQILLVEKDPDGCSTAWRLGDMAGIRRDENYYGKYRAGAYGAIPDI